MLWGYIPSDNSYPKGRTISARKNQLHLLFFSLQVLYAQDVDQRSTTFEKALEMGEQYQRRAK